MIHCKHCGADNYAIDMWCSNCSQHLDWAPPAAAGVSAGPEPIAASRPAPEAAAASQGQPEAAPAAEAEPGPVAAVAPEPEQPALGPETEPVKPAEPAVPVAAAASTAPVPTPVEPPAPARSRRKALVWIFPLAAAAVLAVLLAMPVLGWFKAAGQRDTSQLPLTGFNSSSPSSSPAATASPIAEPTPSASDQPSAQPAAQPFMAQPSPVVQQPAPAPAIQSGAGDPRGSIARFYQAVAAHQFDAAAATWSARMQSAYPPPQYINQRFAYTQQMDLRQAQVVAENGQTATVYIDLIEIYAGSSRHWVGTWQLVETSSGWLLNQPNLRAAS